MKKHIYFIMKTIGSEKPKPQKLCGDKSRFWFMNFAMEKIKLKQYIDCDCKKCLKIIEKHKFILEDDKSSEMTQ